MKELREQANTSQQSTHITPITQNYTQLSREMHKKNGFCGPKNRENKDLSHLGLSFFR